MPEFRGSLKALSRAQATPNVPKPPAKFAENYPSLRHNELKRLLQIAQATARSTNLSSFVFLTVIPGANLLSQLRKKHTEIRNKTR
jgi:hypothetical protein